MTLPLFTLTCCLTVPPFWLAGMAIGWMIN